MTTNPPIDAPRVSGLGRGWTRVAQAIADTLPPAEIDAIWLFQPVRREDREWGVAVVARRTEDGRRRIYTASYMLIVRGRERGQGKIAVDEVGESPATVLHDVLAGVQARAGETEPPVEIDPTVWFPPEDEEAGPDAAAPDAHPAARDDTHQPMEGVR